MKRQPLQQQHLDPSAVLQHLSPVARAVATVCAGFTMGGEVLAPFCVTYEAGLRPVHLVRLVEGASA